MMHKMILSTMAILVLSTSLTSTAFAADSVIYAPAANPPSITNDGTNAHWLPATAPDGQVLPPNTVGRSSDATHEVVIPPSADFALARKIKEKNEKRALASKQAQLRERHHEIETSRDGSASPTPVVDLATIGAAKKLAAAQAQVERDEQLLRLASSEYASARSKAQAAEGSIAEKYTAASQAAIRKDPDKEVYKQEYVKAKKDAAKFAKEAQKAAKDEARARKHLDESRKQLAALKPSDAVPPAAATSPVTAAADTTITVVPAAAKREAEATATTSATTSEAKQRTAENRAKMEQFLSTLHRIGTATSPTK